MTQPTILITGANRGIGLKFTDLYAQKKFNVATGLSLAKKKPMIWTATQEEKINISFKE